MIRRRALAAALLLALGAGGIDASAPPPVDDAPPDPSSWTWTEVGHDEAVLGHALDHRLADVGVILDDGDVYGLIHVGTSLSGTLTLWHRL